jgi:uncharacterized protein
VWSFLAFSTSLLAVIYGYTGWRLIASSRLGAALSAALWTMLAISAFLPAIALAAEHNHVVNIGKLWTSLLVWAAYLTLGFVLFAFVLALARDLVVIIGVNGPQWVSRIRHWLNSENTAYVFDSDRRDFIMQASNAGIVAISSGMTGYGIWSARRLPPTKFVEVVVPGLSDEFDGFQIAQISDIHVSPTIGREFVEKIVGAVNQMRPDVIAITGDLVDGSVERLREDVAPLADLDAPYGKFFVTGNHEYYSGADSWIKHARNGLGWDVLMNEHRVIERNNAHLVIAGITDYSRHRTNESDRSDPERALLGAPDDATKVLLAHQPMSVFAADHAGFDLQISGHTHGGQFFPWNIAVHWVQPYVSGLNKHNGMQIYVSRGTGYWGPPLRVGSPSEITLLTLRSPGEAHGSSVG